MPAGFLRRLLSDHVGPREAIVLVAASIALLALAAWALWQLAPPAPSRRIVMTTGAKDGAYHAYAQRYREELAAYGIELELRPSRGAAENLERLKSGAGGVEVGLVQGGLAQGEDTAVVLPVRSTLTRPS